jgi:hypothetical protein
MIVEYCKYLVILAREAFLGLGPRSHGHAPQQNQVSLSDAVMARLVRATHDHRLSSVTMGPPHSAAAQLQRGTMVFEKPLGTPAAGAAA